MNTSRLTVVVLGTARDRSNSSSVAAQVGSLGHVPLGQGLAEDPGVGLAEALAVMASGVVRRPVGTPGPRGCICAPPTASVLIGVL